MYNDTLFRSHVTLFISAIYRFPLWLLGGDESSSQGGRTVLTGGANRPHRGDNSSPWGDNSSPQQRNRLSYPISSIEQRNMQQAGASDPKGVTLWVAPPRLLVRETPVKRFRKSPQD